MSEMIIRLQGGEEINLLLMTFLETVYLNTLKYGFSAAVICPKSPRLI